MMPLSAGAIAATQTQHNANPWVWLYEIWVEQTETQTQPFRITSHDQSITWGGNLFKPFPVEHEALRMDGSGNLQALELRVANIRRNLSRPVHIARGLANNDVRIVGLNKAALTPSDAAAWTFRVTSSAANRRVVILRLGQPQWMGRAMPDGSFIRDRCEHLYKGPMCAYKGLLSSCKHTFVDCNAHGVDEVANGLPKIHPRRFGSEPAIPRRTA